MRFLVIAALTVTGCHAAPDNGQKQAIEQTPKHPWRKLPDGSWGWLEASPSEKFANEQAERCWPSKGRWDCLSASTLVQVGDMEPPTVFASRYIKARYTDPAIGIGDDAVRGGYSCQSINGKMIRESIFQNGQGGTSHSLQTNDVLIGQQGGGVVWSPDFVIRYMRENSVEPTLRYLDCLHVTTMIVENSLATINTTSLKYGMMTGRDDVMLYDMEGRKEEP